MKAGDRIRIYDRKCIFTALVLERRGDQIKVRTISKLGQAAGIQWYSRFQCRKLVKGPKRRSVWLSNELLSDGACRDSLVCFCEECGHTEGGIRFREVTP